MIVGEVQGTEETAEGLPMDGLGVTMDVTAPDEVEAAVETAMDALGGVDVLVDNAAIYPPLVPKRDRRFDEIPIDEWRHVIDIKTTGVFICCQQVLPEMMKQGSGSVINISSAVI